MEEGGGPPSGGSDDRIVLSQEGVAPSRQAPRRGFLLWLWRGLGLVKIALEATVLAAALWLFVFQVSVVSGHSMDPSLEPGDRLVVDKLCHYWREIKRFDIVVFGCRDTPGVDYVKRVVGLPGEVLELRGAELFVNGQRVEQSFPFEPDETWLGPIQIPEGSFFVLGDNRPRSRDSRAFGPIRKEDIKGVVRFRLYPFDRAGTL